MGAPIAVPHSAPYSHALRLKFEYDADSISLRRVRRVAMRVPAPTSPPPGDDAIGHWLAVEDSAGRVIYHFPLHNPTRQDREVFTDDRGKPARADNPSNNGSFEILVPELPGGEQLVLHGPHHGPSEGPVRFKSRSKRLAVHTFGELRGLAGGRFDHPDRGPQS